MQGQTSKLAAVLLALVALVSVPCSAIPAGPAQATIEGDKLKLENNALAVTWRADRQGLRPLTIKDKLSNTVLESVGDAFVVVLKDGQRLEASRLKMVGSPQIEKISAKPNAVKLGDRSAGKAISAFFMDPDGKMHVRWRAVLRDNARYIRQIVTFKATGKALPIKTITLIDLRCRGAQVIGTVAGSPVIAEGMFFAYEHPNASNVIDTSTAPKHITCSLTRNMPLKPNHPLVQSSVIGVAPAGQRRRAFAQYIEMERPRPYRPFLHYNSWYDIAWPDRKMNEQQCLDVIDAFGKELTQKRGVNVDSFVFDDGWDDNKTLWGFHEDFPNGFTPLTSLARKYDSAIGVWLSPWGGYAQAKAERLKYGRTQGFETNNNGFSLAGPKYYARFRDVCAEMITKYDVNYFKFDGVGIGNDRDGADDKFLPDIEGQLALCAELRALRPDVYLSITTGTWPSPYWLFYGDSIWRNGHDCGFHGAGTMRQKWITYRDMITYRMIVQRAPLYPLNSLMVQGICYAQLGTATRMANDLGDIVDEIWMLFGSGTQLQELYVTPGMMTPPMWDALAQATAWSREQADVLVDVHWIGGDPGKGEAYGYASWSPRKGILVLRNPSEKQASFRIDVQEAFELPADAARSYRLASPWKANHESSDVTLRAGEPHAFDLAPFEALVLEALPIPLNRSTETIGHGNEAAFFVSPQGDDSNPGTKAQPFKTLEAARDAGRRADRHQGTTIWLRTGIYERTTPLQLTSADSGTPAQPVTYRAWPNEEVRIVGGKVIEGWKPVTDETILRRLVPEARENVIQVDLKALGLTDYGQAKGGGLELFFDDRPMTLARWPNENFVKITGLVEPDTVNVRGTKGSKTGKFMYDGDRPKRWVQENDAWVHGYWFWDWSDQRQKIESIDTEKRIIAVTPPYHNYGYRVGQWFYGMNMLAELDAPEEWYLDRETGLLYFWPPKPVAQGRAVVSVSNGLLSLRHVANVTFEGLIFEACRGTAVVMSDCTQTRIAGCVLRNLGDSAVRIGGGEKNRVVACDIYGTGKGCISLRGGDRAGLTPAGHVAENNHIHHYGRWNRMYTPAISLSGVGNRAAHNLIHEAPHMAVMFSGNDHTIEFNEIHHVCLESNDAGAIYSGRDWTMRGTVIRHNYLHHIVGFQGRGCVGVYLDDMFCDVQIYGNLFYQVTRAAFIGGGRDCTVENNIFVDCRPALHIDARAMNWASYHVATTMTDRLKAMPYTSELWRQRYPRLVSILADEPAAPKGNLVARNISVGGRWDGVRKEAKPYVTFTDNCIDQENIFVGTPPETFRLRDDAPVHALGFKPIPIDKIGLYQDKHRRELPPN